MNVAEAEVVLGELAASMTGKPVEIGTSGRPPHDSAYVKLGSASRPDDFAIVSTPGVGWFEIEVAGGFRTGRADDLATDEEVREYLDEYLRAAIAYLDGRRSTGKSRLFRIPFVTVHADGGDLKLVLSARADLKHIFKR